MSILEMPMKIEQIRERHKNCTASSGCESYDEIHFLLDQLQAQRKWEPFSIEMQDKQYLPPVKRYVLLQVARKKELGHPPSVAVGYLKFAGGDRTCPYFVVPGVGGHIEAWCDCLGDDFKAPLWKGAQV